MWLASYLSLIGGKKEGTDHVITFDNQIKTASQGKYAALSKKCRPIFSSKTASQGKYAALSHI